jgi:hypothetical protein
VDTVLRIGNASGFYGDRFAAFREMLEGGQLDVLTGDYLAELTMLILGRQRLQHPERGYAATFLRQLEECLGLALERRVTIVSNAGGLNPAGLAADAVTHVAVLPDGARVEIPHPSPNGGGAAGEAGATEPPPARARGRTHRLALGAVAGARSGDKGGDANIGVWARREAAWPWLAHTLTIEMLHRLLPETAGFPVRRHVFPNLRAINFTIEGLLGEGVASAARFDPQAEALGEWLRSRFIDVPEELA